MPEKLLHNIRRADGKHVTECPRCTHPTRENNERNARQKARRHVAKQHPGAVATFTDE